MPLTQQSLLPGIGAVRSWRVTARPDKSGGAAARLHEVEPLAGEFHPTRGAGNKAVTSFHPSALLFGDDRNTPETRHRDRTCDARTSTAQLAGSNPVTAAAVVSKRTLSAQHWCDLQR